MTVMDFLRDVVVVSLVDDGDSDLPPSLPNKSEFEQAFHGSDR